MRNDLVALLKADAGLMGVLTGGVHTVELSRKQTPDAYDQFNEVLPCCVVRMQEETPWGPHADGARHYFALHPYEQGPGRVGIEAARQRLYGLLHRQRFAISGGGLLQMAHSGDSLDLEDPDLHIPLIISRYAATKIRRRG